MTSSRLKLVGAIVLVLIGLSALVISTIESRDPNSQKRHSNLTGELARLINFLKVPGQGNKSLTFDKLQLTELARQISILTSPVIFLVPASSDSITFAASPDGADGTATASLHESTQFLYVEALGAELQLHLRGTRKRGSANVETPIETEPFELVARISFTDGQNIFSIGSAQINKKPVSEKDLSDFNSGLKDGTYGNIPALEEWLKKAKLKVENGLVIVTRIG